MGYPSRSTQRIRKDQANCVAKSGLTDIYDLFVLGGSPMPFENPEPGRYWGYHCVKCHEAIAISRYREASGWRGWGSFTLDCMNWDCQFQTEYPLVEIRALEITAAQT